MSACNCESRIRFLQGLTHPPGNDATGFDVPSLGNWFILNTVIDVAFMCDAGLAITPATLNSA